MKGPRIDVGRIRREQIVEATVAIIDEEGLQNLSLSKIEDKARMSRGQLTYYFPNKEDILLAAFDRLLELMHQRLRSVRKSDGCPFQDLAAGWERIREILTFFVLQPPEEKDFHSLQYTFLSQITHREDFRQRLASLYEEWRRNMAMDADVELARQPANGQVSARTVATLIQAILHGLAMQRAADPGAYDRQEMLTLCLKLLGDYLQPPPPAPDAALHTAPARGGEPLPNGDQS
jgi:AcrR family transcriptional regulator